MKSSPKRKRSETVFGFLKKKVEEFTAGVKKAFDDKEPAPIPKKAVPALLPKATESAKPVVKKTKPVVAIPPKPEPQVEPSSTHTGGTSDAQAELVPLRSKLRLLAPLGSPTSAVSETKSPATQ